MKNKTKKILGLIFGILLPGFIGWLAIMAGGLNIFLSIFYFVIIISIIGFAFQKYIDIRYYVMAIFFQVLPVLALFLFILGACSEQPFMGSPNPGAGTPFFIGAFLCAIGFIALIIFSIKTIINSKPEPEEDMPVQQDIRRYESRQDSDLGGISKMTLFWVGFSITFFLIFGFGGILGMFFGMLASLGMSGMIVSAPLAFAVISLLAYMIFRKNNKVKYVFLGLFTGVGMIILWAGSCFGVLAMFGDAGILPAMLAAVAIPIIVFISVIKKIKNSLNEQKPVQMHPKMHEIWKD